jgi:hypothetical protein
MSTLGKVLAILNVFGAIALAGLAALNYGTRQQWAYAVFRNDLALNGLPVDENQTDAEGRPLVRELGDPSNPGQTLKELFPSSPVTTQEAEVQRVRGLIDSKISQAGDEAAQNKMRAGILLPLVETTAERERLMDVINRPAPQPDDASFTQTELDKAFQAATGGDKNDRAGRRRAIAHLLLNVSSALIDPPPEDPVNFDVWQSPAFTRALTVVGWEAAVHEMAEQTERLNRTATDLAGSMQTERERFVSANKGLIDQLQNEALRVKALGDLLAQKKDQADKQEELVRQRMANVKLVSDELDSARQTTDKTLKSLQALGQSLFDERVKLREATSHNQQLERNIRDLEKNR